MRTSPAMWAVAGVLGACWDDVAAPAVAAPAVAPAVAAAVAPEVYVVWRDDGEQPVSVWLVAEASGARVVAARDGVVVAAAGTLHAVRTRPVTAREADCGCVAAGYDAGDADLTACLVDVAATAVELVDLTTGAVTRRWGGDDAPIGESDADVAVDVLGSFGPYLVAATSVAGYPCGAAHGYVAAAFEVVDVRGGRRVDVGLAGVRPERDVAQAALIDAGGALDPDQKPNLTMFVPSWDTSGAARLALQYTTDACYACGDGSWSSYTVSARVPTDAMPARLAPWASPPPAVAEHLAGAAAGGWSRVDAAPERRAALLEAFRR